ncbi:MAG: HAMP domain-containing histidine kinase [Lewinellaceae bacterium]|nr:HAMP domain-containing histidine kinase [Lewinellaceae bacterium]
MTNTIIRRVILLGAFAILSLLSVQTYWVLISYNIQEREFNRKVYQALLDASNHLSKLERFDLPQKDLIDQPYSNYYVVNLENQFSADNLEHYLQKAFAVQNLYEDFQYGMYDCSSNQMVTWKMIKYTDKEPFLVGNISHEPLPAHTKSDLNYYFGVRFPNKTANILSNMWIVVVFTILMLITVAFFIYAMFVILRQKQLSEMQRDFINNMTHEFKTPISTINISTDVFLQSGKIKEDPRLNRYAGIIKEQVLRLNTQVEKVLQLAKIERDSIELNLEEIDLAELTRSMLPSLELKVHERKGTLSLLLDAKNPMVTADKLHLTNILHNLADNAVKYTKGVPDISISLQDGPANHLVLRIIDNGIGISKEHQKRVFDKFYRVPTGNVHNIKGFGLGLFYVKKMCREHHWKLNLESQPGKGTIIEIVMPHSKRSAASSHQKDEEVLSNS